MTFFRSRWVDRPEHVTELEPTALPAGFRAAGVAAGLKPAGLDVGMMVFVFLALDLFRRKIGAAPPALRVDASPRVAAGRALLALLQRLRAGLPPAHDPGHRQPQERLREQAGLRRRPQRMADLPAPLQLRPLAHASRD